MLYRGLNNRNESLKDYINRLSERNGYTNYKTFERAIIKEFKATHLNKNFSLSFFGKRRLSLEYIFQRNIPLDCSNMMYFRDTSVWLERPRVCKSCLAENPYIRFFWRLRLYDSCHIHGENLLDGGMPDDLVGSGFLGEKNYVVRAVKKYESYLASQRLIIDEVDTVLYEQEVIEALGFALKNNENYNARVLKVKEESLKGKYIGLGSQERIYTISEGVALGDNDVEAIVRIIVLIVCNRRNDALFCKTKWGEGFKLFQSYALFRLGTDRVISTVIDDIHYRATKLDSESLDVKGLMGELCDNEFLQKKLQLTVYYTRVIDSWDRTEPVYRQLAYNVRYRNSVTANVYREL
ncbi:MAG: TniQ family protein [Colwellia sp.]